MTQPNPTKNRKTMNTGKVTIFVSIALVAGFLGGVKFSDHANKQLIGTTAINMPTDMPMDMPVQGSPMQKGTMPGPVNMDTQQAIVKMEEMLKSDPGNVQLIVHLGNLYYDTNNPQKAVDTYEKALALNRKDANVLTDCGNMYRALKKYDKALAYFKEATQVDPTHFQSWYNMGIVYREDLQQYQKAIDTWNQLLVKIPNTEHVAQVKEDIQKTKAMM